MTIIHPVFIQDEFHGQRAPQHYNIGIHVDQRRIISLACQKSRMLYGVPTFSRALEPKFEL